MKTRVVDFPSMSSTAADRPRRRKMPIIDTDVHQSARAGSDLVPHLDPAWRSFGIVTAPGVGQQTPVGVLREDARPPDGGPSGSDPAFLIEHHLEAFDIDYAILNGSGILGLGVAFNADHAAASATAYNRWMIERWLDFDPRFLGSLIVAPQDASKAAAEIRRAGDHPQMAQVLMCSGTRVPFGERCYHPIYEAAQEMELPVALHPGTECSGLANPFAAGYPSNYCEWHTNIPQNYMAQVTSLVLGGVFEKYPRLRFVCIEGGIAWLPHLMWRMDKNYKALRTLTPWLRRLPSEYILEHIRLTTQPIEEPENPEHLLQIFDMVQAHRTVMFSSDYPHWDFDSPRAALPKLPADLAERIYYKTAQEFYGLPELAVATDG